LSGDEETRSEKSMSEQKKSTVTDISHMYVCTHQRDSLIEQAFERFRKRGYSFNQSKALAVQAVDGFLAERRRKQVEDIGGKVLIAPRSMANKSYFSKVMEIKGADDAAED
jgi:hypothetical protein